MAVFGLGNPGKKYERTRHNVGFLTIERLAKTLDVDVSHRRYHAEVGEAKIGSLPALLVKPQTYMNESGRSVRAVADWYRLELSQIFVICDDLDLEPGRIRIRPNGSSGGHNGLKSIAAALGTTEFPRLRIGIGRPEPADAIDYVLAPLSAEQRDVLVRAAERAADAVKCWAIEGIESCMNRFN